MSKRLKLEFPGSNNLTISGFLETPNTTPHAYVLFAHCFTCGKNSIAASRISKSLVAQGFGVLRFDFTGVGASEGEFANSNFSTNIQDIVLAANYLRDHHQAPMLLIGHSLGGASVLYAASQIPEAVGVVTVAAPSGPHHVVKQFSDSLDHIKTEGSATVSLSGRDFVIKKQFLDDLESHEISSNISKLGKALLVFHSPLDQTVSINEAEKIYTNAKHPKSFISLGNADHLLTNAKDAEYVSSIITSWASRYI
jgi:alpha-beta hydrolase superfamily lysophospholipase